MARCAARRFSVKRLLTLLAVNEGSKEKQDEPKRATRSADDAADPDLAGSWRLGLVRTKAYPFLQGRGRKNHDDPHDKECDTASDQHRSPAGRHVDVGCNRHRRQDPTKWAWLMPPPR
jgi:hypothetical protein